MTMNAIIKAQVLGSQTYDASPYRKSMNGIQGVKVSCFELKSHATSLGRERIAVTNGEGFSEFTGLGHGFYIIRCNGDIHTDHLVEINPRTFTPDVKLVKFEVNV